MRRGEIWTVSASAYEGKPRPAVIVQSDRFDATASITICAFTTNPAEAPFARLEIMPTRQNGLHAASRLMVDKITTIAKDKLGDQIGELATEDVARLNRAMMVFLGLV